MSRQVIIASSSYEEKYYFNEEFKDLPEAVKEDLIKIAVSFVEEVGGTFNIGFDVEDNVEIYVEASADEEDILYDEIGSRLILGRIEKEYKEFFEALTKWYTMVYIKKYTDK